MLSIKEATDLMQQNNIRRLPVLDNKGKLVGNHHCQAVSLD